MLDRLLSDRAEEAPMLSCPPFKLVVPVDDLIEDRIDTAHRSVFIHALEPVPEPWSKIECVVAILRLNQDVGINEPFSSGLVVEVEDDQGGGSYGGDRGGGQADFAEGFEVFE